MSFFHYTTKPRELQIGNLFSKKKISIPDPRFQISEKNAICDKISHIIQIINTRRVTEITNIIKVCGFPAKITFKTLVVFLRWLQLFLTDEYCLCASQILPPTEWYLLIVERLHSSCKVIGINVYFLRFITKKEEKISM